jgi:hypothetical protein
MTIDNIYSELDFVLLENIIKEHDPINLVSS